MEAFIARVGETMARDPSRQTAEDPKYAEAEASSSLKPRSRGAPELFSQTEHAEWSPYKMSTLGFRKGSADKQIEDDLDAASAAEPELRAQLEALFARCHATATTHVGSASAGMDS